MLKLKQMNAQQLVLAFRSEASTVVAGALTSPAEMAAELHAGQIRKDPVQGRINTPYIEHCLRNALRLLRLRCTDIDVLIATILHDAIEDCAHVAFPDAADEPAARQMLRERFLAAYGPVVVAYVDGVTNAYQSRAERDSMSDEEKFALYRAKVSAAIRTSLGVYLVKLTDFIDNAGSLHHTPAGQSHKAKRLATKYLPLVEDFRIVGAAYAMEFPDAIDWAEVDAILIRIGERLADMV